MIPGGSISRAAPWIVFLSAFLAFVVQPMEAKSLLPWFGGASAVWATGLLFFSGLLFFGYLYVFLLVRLTEERQMWVHRVALLLAGSAAIGPHLFPGVLRLDPAWAAAGEVPPAMGTLLALLLSVGPAYLILATTSPLLQVWWGRSEEGEPYHLYALSNVGSLLALLAYPIVIEPNLPLPLQGKVWAVLFLLLVGLTYRATRLVGGGAAADRFIDGRSGGRIHGPGGGKEGVRKGQADRGRVPEAEAGAGAPAGFTSHLEWVACAALPSFLLVAATTQITQVVAPVPLLWTVPLALYLVSFILAFRGMGSGLSAVAVLLGAAAFVVRANAADRAVRAEIQVVAALVLLFMCGLVLHARLYERRPVVSSLPLFFVLISFGGMVGTLAGSLLPPLLFPDLWEFPLAVWLTAGVAGSLFASALLGGGSARGTASARGAASGKGETSGKGAASGKGEASARGAASGKGEAGGQGGGRGQGGQGEGGQAEPGDRVAVAMRGLGRSAAGSPLLRAVQVGCVIVAAIFFGREISGGAPDRLARSRNFFGSAMVSVEGEVVVLSHGMTRHGSQFLDPERAAIPTAYYSPTSGVGRAAIHLQVREEDRPVRFGLVGLGAGTLAAYCRPGDTFVFYELDPRITTLARRYFTYLQMCPGVAVRHGDGRILLERERAQGARDQYDLIALDAFSDDAIPVHLLTVEAFQLYLERLAPGGILAVHTSNIYIELAPVVLRIAEELGWSAIVVRDTELSSPGSAWSDWVLLARDPAEFQSAPFARVVPYRPAIRAPLWTDAHSSIVPLLRGTEWLREFVRGR